MNGSSENRFKTTDTLPGSVLYYHPTYLAAQTYKSLRSFKNHRFEVHFEIEDGIANSLPKSPFGGILAHASANDFTSFWEDVLRQFRQEKVREVRITQPPAYYTGFISDDQLSSLGFSPLVSETNQYIPLTRDIRTHLHSMQKRKLAKNAHLEIKEINTDSLQEIHHFIAKCRQHQGLEINISLETLLQLTTTLPDAYEVYGGYFGSDLACAVVMTLPTDQVAYYYLPASHPDFKKESPMVGMIQHLAEAYQNRGYQFLDMGISSIHGKLQTTLYDFKKRMGALNIARTTYSLRL